MAVFTYAEQQLYNSLEEDERDYVARLATLRGGTPEAWSKALDAGVELSIKRSLFRTSKMMEG